ncbi:MAG: hypothetical protein ACPGVD_11345 [Flavobacteriales bacterium]
MKIALKLLIILIISACKDGQNATKKADILINEEIYVSNNESFQKNFFLKIYDEKAIIYGWEISKENDTIYYRSEGAIELDSSDNYWISLKSYQFTDEKFNKNNLNNFKENHNIKIPFLGIHSSFWGSLKPNGSFDFLAVKDIYSGRADKFIFEKVH